MEKYFIIKNNFIKLESSDIFLIKVEGLLERVFPFVNRQETIADISTYLPDKLNIINYIIAYTDIIDFQHFGNKKTQMLRFIPITYHNNDIITNFDNHHYVKVKNSFINSINIKLRDIWGNPIHFSDFFSYVIVNLHLRPI